MNSVGKTVMEEVLELSLITVEIEIKSDFSVMINVPQDTKDLVLIVTNFVPWLFKSRTFLQTCRIWKRIWISLEVL